MSVKIKGQFKVAAEYKQFTDSFGAQKFYMDIDMDSEYPSVAEFQVNNNKIDLSQFKAGQEMTVSFNISGRKVEKDDKSWFFQNLTAWKIDTEQASAAPVQQAEQIPPPDKDDLPF